MTSKEAGLAERAAVVREGTNGRVKQITLDLGSPTLPESWQTAPGPAAEPSPGLALVSLKFLTRLALAAAIVSVTLNLGFLVYDLHHKSYGDGPMLAMCERLRAEPISPEWMRKPPYTLSCYGPAFYYFTNALAELGGWRHSLEPGRIVSLLAALAAAAFAAVAAGRQTKSAEIGLLAALMFMTSAPFSEWTPHARVDMLGIACAAAAFMVVGKSRRSLIVAACCIAAGSLSKPTIALSAAPIFAHLLANRRYRDAGVFAASVAALGAAVWAAVEWASHGFFLTAVLTGNRNPMLPWHGYFFLYQFLSFPIGAVSVLVVGQLLIASPQRFFRSLYSLGFAVSLAISLVAICKQGAELNYFLEASLLGALAIAVDGVPRFCLPGPRRGLVVMACTALVLGLPYAREVKHQYHEPAEQPKYYDMIENYLADESPEVELLADGRMVDAVLAAGRTPWLNDSYLYMLMVDNGTIDPSPLLDRMRDGRIKWLFLRKDYQDHVEASTRQGNCWPVQVLDAFPRYYELVEKGNGLWVYRHRSYGVDSTGRGAPANAPRRRQTPPGRRPAESGAPRPRSFRS
ncbi:MAG TPA: glycosyltransferase family 39 protein [Pirellulales bacterium]|nr:glycosyltransferase family 39 protein [Pirellulales bacterium]